MKLLRYGSPGEERPGVLDATGRIRSLSEHVDDIDGRSISPDVMQRLREVDIDALPSVSDDVRLGPPIAGVGKIVAIGLNYRDHAAEAGQAVPDEPILFMKATTSITGPNDLVRIPRGSTKTDYEAELGVVIGTRASYVEATEALAHVAGYCVVNDVSERAFQLESTGQWVKGKSADTFCPFGPWLVTADEVPDPQSLEIWLEVDGECKQQSSTGQMIFDVAHLVSYISKHMTLMPGDLIATGTPPGVGLGQRPQVFLRPGQRVTVGVGGLGQISNLFVAYEG